MALRKGLMPRCRVRTENIAFGNLEGYKIIQRQRSPYREPGSNSGHVYSVNIQIISMEIIFFQAMKTWLYNLGWKPFQENTSSECKTVKKSTGNNSIIFPNKRLQFRNYECHEYLQDSYHLRPEELQSFRVEAIRALQTVFSESHRILII